MDWVAIIESVYYFHLAFALVDVLLLDRQLTLPHLLKLLDQIFNILLILNHQIISLLLRVWCLRERSPVIRIFIGESHEGGLTCDTEVRPGFGHNFAHWLLETFSSLWWGFIWNMQSIFWYVTSQLKIQLAFVSCNFFELLASGVKLFLEVDETYLFVDADNEFVLAPVVLMMKLGLATFITQQILIFILFNLMHPTAFIRLNYTIFCAHCSFVMIGTFFLCFKCKHACTVFANGEYILTYYLQI